MVVEPPGGSHLDLSLFPALETIHQGAEDDVVFFVQAIQDGFGESSVLVEFVKKAG